MTLVSIKIPDGLLRRIKGNRSLFFRQAAMEKLTRTPPPEWTPKTPYGKKLWAMRTKAQADGVRELSREELARELKERSGLR